MKKLNMRGFAHWIIAAAVVVVIGGIGTYVLTQSHADSPVSGPVGYGTCQALGRAWTGSTNNGKCSTTKCITTANGNHMITNRAYDYCSQSVSFLGQKTCKSLHRAWLVQVDGCARRAEQTNTTAAVHTSPFQCEWGYRRYVVGKGNANDYCDTYFVPKG